MEKSNATGFVRPKTTSLFFDKIWVPLEDAKKGKHRLVWMFPIRPVPENDVKKPAIFVFKDMDDYLARGKNADSEYNKSRVKVTKKKAIKTELQKVRYKAFGEGTVVGIKNGFIIVDFAKVGRKQLNYQICLDKGLIEFTD